MNKYIKIGLIVIVVLIVFILAFTVGGGNNNQNTNTNTSNDEIEVSEDANLIVNNAQQESTEIPESEKKEFTQIDVTTYLEYLNGSEQKIILLARPTCSYCQIAEPIIQNVAYEYNIDINYLNTDNFQGSDQTAFVKSNEEFSEGYGTPFLFIVKDGGIIDSVDGLTDRDHYVAFFKKNGFIA